MILVPGRNAVSIAMPRSPRKALGLALLLPLFTGGVAQRYVSTPSSTGRVAMASLMRVPDPVLRVSDSVRDRVRHSLTASAPRAAAESQRALPLPPTAAAVPQPALPAPAETATQAATEPAVDVKAMLRSLRKGSATPEELDKLPYTGTLRLEGLHLSEILSVRPFDANLAPDPLAMSQISHLMRCRITGTEIPIDPRLVQVLVKLHTLYNRPIQLVSGHRQPHTIGTKKTSQHTLGRAADIRIPGVGIEELKRVAMKLGARGIGLYPEKGFVHVDVREKNRYYWVYTGAGGEQSDMSTPRPARPKAESHGHADPESEVDGEEHDESAHALQPQAAVVAPVPAAPALDEAPKPSVMPARDAIPRKLRSTPPAAAVPASAPQELPQPAAAMPANPYDAAPQAAPAPAAPEPAGTPSK